VRFPLFIARRYLLAKKSHNLINVISLISFAATAIVSLAMIVILSAFNGLEGLVMTMYNSFSADIRIVPEKGKVFEAPAGWKEKIMAVDGVASYWEILEDNALFRYQAAQHIGRVKGVDAAYIRASGLDSMLYKGQTKYYQDGGFDALLGGGVDFYLNYNLDDEVNPIAIYAPDRKAKPGPGIMSAFHSVYARGSGLFSIQADIDNRFVVIPLKKARELFDYPQELSYIELGLKPGNRTREIKNDISEIVGAGFKVEDRREQQAFLYRVMRSEKWAIFLILSFILLIAAFNLVGAVTMLIIDKRKDSEVFRSLGAEQSSIRRIFLSEGMMIALGGTFLGLALGLIVVLLQQEFGLVRMGGSNMVVDYYPVRLKFSDFLSVSAMVAGIGILASWLSTRLSLGQRNS
jgi:lipoprotein-releasing system permease protein